MLGVVNLLSHSDLLSRCAVCGHTFPGNYRHLSPQRGVHGIVNLGGVVKTLRRSNSLSRTVFSTAGSFGHCLVNSPGGRLCNLIARFHRDPAAPNRVAL